MANVPFGAAAEGHSPWSTVKKVVVIDLSRYKGISIQVNIHTATVWGGILIKELQVALCEFGQFSGMIRALSHLELRLPSSAVASGNTVGVRPYMTRGGISSYTPLIGYACENIHLARIVVARGEVVTATAT